MNGRFEILLVVFLFFSIRLYADDTAIRDFYEASYTFDIFKNSTEAEKRNNYVLQQIAFDNSISFSDLNLTVDYSLAVEIKPATEKSYGFRLQLEILEANGDTRMRKMDVSGFLHPDICAFNYRLFNRRSGKEYKQATFQGKLQKGRIMIAHLIRDDASKDDIELEFSDLHFYFSEAQLNRFKAHIALIDRYYACSLILEKIMEEAQHWRPDQGREFVQHYFRINELERLYAFVKRQNFGSVFSLQGHDPAGLLDNLEKLSNLNRRLQTLLTEASKSKQLFLPNVSLLSARIVEYQQGYAKYLSGSAYSNSDVLPELSKINYPNAWFADILDFFGKGLTKNQQSQLSRYFKQFVFRLRASHLELARNYIESKHYELAIIQADNAARLKIAATEESNARVKELKTQAITGLYKSYLNIANRALQVPNIEMARLYMKDAADFYAKNKNFIAANVNMESPDTGLIDALLARAALHKSKKQYPEASKMLMEAAKLCRSPRLAQKEQEIMAELREIYKLESYRIIELKDSRLLGKYKGNEEDFAKEIKRLIGDQQLIMDELQRLNE